MDDAYEPSPRTRVVRKKKRATYSKAQIHAIFDEALIGALAAVIDGEPQVQPMIHARMDDALILHGSSANRMLSHLAQGARCTFNVTLVDGLVLGRSVPDHTFRYRSATVYGAAQPVAGAAEKRRLMKIVFDHIIAARWESLPPVDEDYLATVQVLVLPLDECVAKINMDGPEDLPGDAWAGIIPFSFAAGAPMAAPGNRGDAPGAVARYKRPQGAS
ncbi:MAG: pyridoxamine 5'-phosphate oxidase family protein [Hyphomonadaceae bacterium]